MLVPRETLRDLQRDNSTNFGDARQAHRDAQLPFLMLTVLGDRTRSWLLGPRPRGPLDSECRRSSDRLEDLWRL